jgi:predicted secreted acid phosphatase
MSKLLPRSIGAAALLALMLVDGVAGAQCPTPPEVHVPPPPAAPLNIDIVKRQLRDYHDKDYATDMAAVFSVAQAYVERRAGEVKNPAVVLDIDETSLSNWPNISADDFGFISSGRCDELPSGPCGFNAWILQAKAEAFPPALKFFNAAKSKGVTIVFITGRRDNQRQATLWNLDQAGYQGWEKLITRPDRDEFKTVRAYKSTMRNEFFAGSRFTLIANIGDQQSDIEQEPGIAGGKAECGFKLPNPFYFIP